MKERICANAECGKKFTHTTAHCVSGRGRYIRQSRWCSSECREKCRENKAK